MIGASQREYAAHIGMTRGAVQRAQDAGRLVLHADRSINVAATDALLAASTDTSKHHIKHSSKPIEQKATDASEMKAVPDLAIKAVADALHQSGEAPSPTASTFLKARTANEVLKAQERTLRLQKLRGELIDRAKAAALVARLSRQDRDSWLNWPARIAAEAAARMSADPQVVNAVLDDLVRRQLTELSEIKPNFR